MCLCSSSRERKDIDIRAQFINSGLRLSYVVTCACESRRRVYGHGCLSVMVFWQICLRV